MQAYSVGYDREWRRGVLRVAPGAQVTVYRAPDALAGVYGRAPVGAVVFLRLRAGG
ncbi:MAG: hypothetical protein M3O02_02900 [Acidobacteriota bacterium]|nr:hypothetical protein [Acidobacteriota bacterium]